MAAKVGQTVLVALVGSALLARVAGAAEVGRAPSPIDATPTNGFLIDPGLPPLPMTPEIRAGFPLRKVYVR